ncbi:hypothetical protein ACP70R_020507 [Stipagrostis hirtigluma subsp. patula]
MDEDEEDWGEEMNVVDSYREDWVRIYGKTGSLFEDDTEIPYMRYTDGPILPMEASPMNLIQIFSVKVVEIKGGLQWPLDVYGHVAVRDSLDHKRNILSRRNREDRQTLASPQDSSSRLTGTSHAIVLLDPVIFEVDLKIKRHGSTSESEDKVLSYHAFCYGHSYSAGFARREVESTEHSTMEFTFAQLDSAVEATIQVHVVEGSSSSSAGFTARFAARTAGVDEDVVLHDSRGEAVAVDDDGLVAFQRRVVVVEERGEHALLTVHVEAAECGGGGGDSVVKKVSFRPRTALRSKAFMRLGFCKLSVVFAWSML